MPKGVPGDTVIIRELARAQAVTRLKELRAEIRTLLRLYPEYENGLPGEAPGESPPRRGRPPKDPTAPRKHRVSAEGRQAMSENARRNNEKRYAPGTRKPFSSAGRAAISAGLQKYHAEKRAMKEAMKEAAKQPALPLATRGAGRTSERMTRRHEQEREQYERERREEEARSST